MISLFATCYPTARLTYIQSTYVELATEQELHRVDMLGKVEARLKRDTGGALVYHSNHRLLTYYQKPLASLDLNHPPDDAVALLGAIDHMVAQLPGGWSDQWLRCQTMQLRTEIARVIARGRGRLLSFAPQVLAEELEVLCWLHNAGTTLNKGLSLPDPWRYRVKPPLAVLTIGDNYIIARDFCVSTRWSASGNTGEKGFAYAAVG